MDLQSVTCNRHPSIPLSDRKPVRGVRHAWHWHIDHNGDDYPCNGRLTAQLVVPA